MNIRSYREGDLCELNLERYGKPSKVIVVSYHSNKGVYGACYVLDEVTGHSTYVQVRDLKLLARPVRVGDVLRHRQIGSLHTVFATGGWQWSASTWAHADGTPIHTAEDLTKLQCDHCSEPQYVTHMLSSSGLPGKRYCSAACLSHALQKQVEISRRTVAHPIALEEAPTDAWVMIDKLSDAAQNEMLNFFFGITKEDEKPLSATAVKVLHEIAKDVESTPRSLTADDKTLNTLIHELRAYVENRRPRLLSTDEILHAAMEKPKHFDRDALIYALWRTDPEVVCFVREKADHKYLIRETRTSLLVGEEVVRRDSNFSFAKLSRVRNIAWSRREPVGSVERAEKRASLMIKLDEEVEADRVEEEGDEGC